MDAKISEPTRRELLGVLRERYGPASKTEKTKILDEFTSIAQCHRKHAIRLLTGVHPATPGTRASAHFCDNWANFAALRPAA